MTDLLSLNRGQYLGQVTRLVDLNGMVAASTVYPPEMPTGALHYHYNPCICLLVSGGSVEHRVGYSYERLPGDLTFCYAGEPHQSLFKKFPSKTINFELETDFLARYEISENMLDAAVSVNDAAGLSVLRMYNELRIGDDLAAASIQILLLGMVDGIKTAAKSEKPAWVVKIYDLLNDRWNERVTLEDLSSALKVHPVTISKYFARYFSCTLGEYVRRLRIGKSLPLIKNSTKSLTEIASDCGFSDQSHFTRTFKEFTGFLPKDFRRL